MGKVRLGCDVGEGVGRSQSVIVVRDDLGVLENFANQFQSKAETTHKISGLAQKWQIGDWMGPPTLRYQGLDGATHSPVARKCGWPLVPFDNSKLPILSISYLHLVNIVPVPLSATCPAFPRQEAPSHEPLEGDMIGTPRPATVFTKQHRMRGSRIHEMRNRVRVDVQARICGGCDTKLRMYLL